MPWVVAALRFDGTEWERAHRVARALRGSGGSPGYIEDWEVAGAIDEAGVRHLVDRLVRAPRVTLALLCEPCRHYQGPAVEAPRRSFRAA